MSDPIRVLVADDEAMVRAGLRMLLESEPDLCVVGEATDGVQAVEAAARARPDVVLMDIRMPRLDGLAAAARVLAAPDPPRVVMLTTFDEDPNLHEALRIGTSGFVLKVSPPEQLLDAVRAAAAGHALIDPAVTTRVIAAFARRSPGPPPPGLDELTPREHEVLLLVARGLSNAEIAAHLVVSNATVKTHVNRLLMKLGLRDRTQAVVLAYESGLVAR
jgi:DNA-binding NarL/FixJ family response regulator